MTQTGVEGVESSGSPQLREEPRLGVLVELRHSPGKLSSFAMTEGMALGRAGFEIDSSFRTVVMRSDTGKADFQKMGASPSRPETFVIRGTVAHANDIQRLKADPNVVAIWIDTPIAPFAGPDPAVQLKPMSRPIRHSCPAPPCDCDHTIPKGSMADVAKYLSATELWAMGYRGQGMVIGIVDGGITAHGRPIKPSEGKKPRTVPQVIGGWPDHDWGTEASQWEEHGNMCATDALGIAPDARILDLRISDPAGIQATIGRALQCFEWAMERHRQDGTPQVLSNSWGIYLRAWDQTYASDPNHVFTRKVREAIAQGIIVLFATGNCGACCPCPRCGQDIGPNLSILGANGDEEVISVGAANLHGHYIGYSSQGPSALGAAKPDVCSISHFAGYFDVDKGTSAATPVLAGVVALLLQAHPKTNQARMKEALQKTAATQSNTGHNNHVGHGVVRALAAYNFLKQAGEPSTPVF